MALFALWRDEDGMAQDDLLHARLLAESHLVPERVTRRALATPGGTWQLAAFAAPTHFHAADDQVWSAAGGGACVMQGVMWRASAGVPRPLDARAIAALLDRADARLPDDVCGEYAVARLLPDGTLLAMADTAGVHQLFHRPDRPHMVANRAAFLAVLTGDWTPDPASGAWLGAIGYRVGGASGWRGVHQVPQAHGFVDGRMQPLPRPDNFAQARGMAAGGDALLDEGIAQAIGAVRLAAGDAPLDLPITGGKDSRAVLALCLAAGLRDRLTLFTRGHAGHPDVRAGQRIAAALGVPHRREPPRGGDAPADLAVDGFVEALTAHTYQTDGGMGGWDLLVARAPGTETLLTGHLGEVLKSFGKDAAEAVEDPIAMVRLQSPFDPMGLLRPETTARLASALRDQMDTALAEGALAGDLPDLFYYRNRVPNWLGGVRGVRAHERQPVMPLGVPALQRLAFRLTPGERRKELLHFWIVQGCAPELLALPFAHQRWSADLPDAPLTEPLLAVADAPLFGSWQWSLNHHPAIRAWLSDFVAGTDLPLWEAIDRATLRVRLRSRRFDYRDAISLLGIVVAAFHQAGLVVPCKIGAAGSDHGDGGRPTLSAPSFPERSWPIEGHIDVVAGAAERAGAGLRTIGRGPATLAGWAFAPDWPGAAPTIEARADGRPVGQAYPTLNRPDLAAAGIGVGSHGFALTLDTAALDGAAALTLAHGGAVLATLPIVREQAR